MTTITLIIALAALIMAYVSLTRAKMAIERADDTLRFLTDLKNRAGADTRELFRELHRVMVRQKKAAGKLEYLPYEITDSCIACGACEAECLEEAIRSGDCYRIIPDLCSACETCADICPVNACVEMKID